MEETNHETKTEHKKRNDWKILSAVLAVVIVILVILLVYPRITGNVVSGETAGNKLAEFLNTRTGGGVTYVSSEDLGSIYSVMVSYQNQTIPVYVSKDGKYFIQGAIPIAEEAATPGESETQTPQEVKKSDKPVVQAFIFSYCPYGLQFEKALLPVYDLLKNKANISIVAIGAMHGEFEHQESLRQISIESIYGKDKLFSYLKEFNSNSDIGSCSGEDTCLNKYLPSIYTKLGIDKTKVEAYMKNNAEAIYKAQGELSSSLGISGSPTFVINGAQVQVSRTPDAIKTAVCNAFTTAPSECSKTLSTEGPSAGFGGSSAGSATTGAQC